MNKFAIAKEMGISRTTLDKYLALPGAPKPKGKDYDLEAVQNFILDHAEKQSTSAKANTEVKSLKERELLAKCVKLEFENQVEMGKYISLAELEQKLPRLITEAEEEFMALAEGKLAGELLTCRKETEIQKKLSTAFNSVFRKLQNKSKKLIPKPAIEVG